MYIEKEEILEDFIKSCKRNLKLYESTMYGFESYMNANAYLNIPYESQDITKEHLKIIKNIISELQMLIMSLERHIKKCDDIVFESKGERYESFKRTEKNIQC